MNNLLLDLQTSSTLLFEWVLTYWIHSTVLFFIVLFLLKIPYFKQTKIADIFWKVVLIGGLFTATFQMKIQFQTVHLASYFEQPTPIVLEEPKKNETVELLATEEIEAGVLDEVLTTALENMPSMTTEEVVATPNKIQVFIGSLSWKSLVTLIWLSISLLLTIRYLGLHLWLLRSMGKRHRVTDEGILGLSNQLLRNTQLQTPLKITYTPQLSSPIVIGNSEICLPERAIYDLSTEHQQSLLAHEMAHIVRKDYYWLLTARLIETIFFFQPLHRITRQRMETTAEHLCDNWASEMTGNAMALAACLVEIATWIAPKSDPVLVSGMALRKSELTNRIHQLINQSSMKMKNLKPVEYIGLLMLLTTFMVVSVPHISLALEQRLVNTNLLDLDIPTWDVETPAINSEVAAISSEIPVLNSEASFQQPMSVTPVDTVPKPKKAKTPKSAPNPRPTPKPAPKPPTPPTSTEIPEVPALPEVPELPKLPEMPELPEIPEFPEMNSLERDGEAVKQLREELKELKELENMISSTKMTELTKKEQEQELARMQRKLELVNAKMQKKLEIAQLEMQIEQEQQMAMIKEQTKADHKRRAKDMELMRKQMEKDRERMRADQERMRKDMMKQREIAMQQREKVMKQREEARAKMKEERKKMEKERDKMRLKLKEFSDHLTSELVKDGIIKRTEDFKSIEVKKKMVKINGKKLQDEQLQKYLDLVHSHFTLEGRSTFMYNK